MTHGEITSAVELIYEIFFRFELTIICDLYILRGCACAQTTRSESLHWCVLCRTTHRHSSLHQLRDFTCRHRAIKECECTLLFHFASGVKESTHSRAIE